LAGAVEVGVLHGVGEENRRLCREAQGNAFVRQALQRVAALWGEPTSTRRVRMPLALRIARKDA
ncbi:hypothetical protein ACLBWA_13525, partial [Pseudomonas aeruginosa]